MSLLEKYYRFLKLWRVVLSHVAEPSIHDVALWSDYPPEIVEKSILRASRRFALEKLSPTFQPVESFKYITAVSRAESAAAAQAAKEVA